jgi:hypothetical protein
MSENPPNRPGSPEDPYGQQPRDPYGQEPDAPRPPEPGPGGGYQAPYQQSPQQPGGQARPGGEPFYSGAAASAANVARSDTRGFFGALFDYSFTHYVTPKVVKIIYVIVTVLILLFYVIGLIAAIVALFNDAFWGGLGFILFGWIIAIVYLALARITLEFYLAVVSVSEKVNLYARRDGVA